MRKVNIGLIGLGTVGTGVYETIVKNGTLIASRTGVSLCVKGVCDKDKKLLNKIKAKKGIIKTVNADTLIKSSDIDIIIELIGGTTAAKKIILNSLKEGKHVVTANKALLSEAWNEIFKTAAIHGVSVKFEASVAGAIPVIRTLHESFVANRIDTIYGILNGTTNYILTLMEEEGYSFTEALKEAQKKGIAESNPELDISGKDSAQKLLILSLIGFGQNISMKDVSLEGISSIEPADIENAKMWGYGIKLLAIAKNSSKGLELRVHPTFLSREHLLSDVTGSDNAVYIKGDLIKDSLLFGKGAGRFPTASSVVGDVTELAREIAFGKDDKPLPYNYNYNAGRKTLRKMEDLTFSFYLRFSVIDKPGVLAGISSILAKHNISIAKVSQKERREGEMVPVLILTHKAKEGNMRKAIRKIDGLKFIKKKTMVIRIEQ